MKGKRKRLERRPQRYWKPDEQNEGAGICIRLGARVTNQTRFGERQCYRATVLEDSDDANGALVAGSEILINCSADLKRLADVPEGSTVWITPAGYESTNKRNPMRAFEIEYE